MALSRFLNIRYQSIDRHMPHRTAEAKLEHQNDACLVCHVNGIAASLKATRTESTSGETREQLELDSWQA